jgi:signal transduction histidine kinase
MFWVNFSLPRLGRLPDRILRKLRLPVVLSSLGLILYYLIYHVAFVPYFGFVLSWQPDNVLRVHSLESYDDSPAARFLRPGDVILAIDGQPAWQSDRRALFAAMRPEYEYTIERQNEQFVVTIPVANSTFAVIVERTAAGIVALIIWIVAALILLCATPQNQAAWKVGSIFIAMAISLVATKAAEAGVPLARLGSEPLLPIVTIAFVSLAMMPRKKPPAFPERIIFSVLYILAGLLGAAFLFEILYLAPRGTSVEILSGFSLYNLLLLLIIAGGSAYLLTLLWRFVFLPPSSHLRSQLRILLLFSSVAILPGLLLTIVPTVLFGVPLMPWFLFNSLLTLVPAGYGFIIYRRNYLGLDLFATQTVTLLLIGLAVMTLYALVLHALQRQGVMQGAGSLPNYLALFAGMVAIPLVGKLCRPAVQALIYGPHRPYQETLSRFVSALSSDPQVETLGQVLDQMMAVLQVRRAALMLADNHDQLICVQRRRVETISPMPLAAASLQTAGPAVRSSYQAVGEPTLLARHPWAELLFFLSVGERPVALLLLGPPIPTGYFNFQQVDFVRQAGQVMAVAAEAIRLFESAREMSRRLMQVRDRERTRLARDIHDDPIQQMSLVINALSRLQNRLHSLQPEASAELLVRKESLQHICAQMRDICAGLRSPMLDQGIQWAIAEGLQQFASDTQLKVIATIRVADDLPISDRVATAVQQICAEALNNVRRHAEATAVHVSLFCQDDHLVLTVADDGKGMPCHAGSVPSLVRARHFGIAGMHERASLVGGELVIGGSPMGGAMITAKVPLVGNEGNDLHL